MTTQTLAQRPGLLRNALRANGVFSGLSGLMLTFGAQPIAAFLGLSEPVILIVIGLGLLLYAAMLFRAASDDAQLPRVGLMAIIGDALWVLGSVILLLTGWPPFTVAGAWAVGIVAAIVADFAIVQFIGWRRIAS